MKKGITVRFEEEEYDEIVRKAKQYRYNSTSEYIRDKVSSETVIKEDYEGKEKICDTFNSMRAEMIEQEKQLRNLLLRTVDSKLSREEFEAMIGVTVRQRERIEKMLNDILFRDFVKEKEIRQEENNSK